MTNSYRGSECSELVPSSYRIGKEFATRDLPFGVWLVPDISKSTHDLVLCQLLISNVTRMEYISSYTSLSCPVRP